MARIFFLGWSGKDLGKIKVIEELKKSGQEIVYWTVVNLDSEVDKSKFPGTIFQEHSDALRALPPEELRDNDFPPPSKDLISRLYEVESVVMTMMNKKFENLGISERKNLYYEHLRYWHGVLQKFQPDIIIYPTVPHTIYDFVAFSIARILNIKNLIIEQSWIGDRMLISNDYQKGFPKLISELTKNRSKNFFLSDLSHDLQDEYSLQNTKGADPTPIFVKHFQAQFFGLPLLIKKIKIIFSSIIDLTFFKKAANLIKSRFGENPIREYQFTQSDPDFSKKFVYLPLQYQPERTSSPQGGIFVDQLLIVETLSAALPEDWFLYVKEHPVQWTARGLNFFNYRFPGFYKKMASLRNVEVVPMGISGYELINHSQAVATISGTSGWEAAARLKPVLVFGYAWYRDCPGVFRVTNAESCRKALDKIKSGFKHTAQDVINYLGSFDKASFHGYFDECGKGMSKLTPAQNAINIFTVLTKALENKNNL